MKAFLLTDIPVWVRPLERALEALGVEVSSGSDPERALAADVIVNRLSTQLLQLDHGQIAAIREALRRWEQNGRLLVNGSKCFEIGLSKLKQHELFEACGVATPQTEEAIAGGRALPGRKVLLKPSAGGFGKGIQILGPDENAPGDLDGSAGWIEQEMVEPVDGKVHRIEIVGEQILYDAATPLLSGDFDYCLANVGDTSVLTEAASLDHKTVEKVIQIARAGSMQLGSLEYFVLGDGRPCFFDFNPVSSLHPKAQVLLGHDPMALTASFIADRIGIRLP
jgi:hypothetical protein